MITALTIRRLSFVVIAILLIFLAPNIGASGRITPESIHGSIRVDAEALIELVEKMPELTIIDSRIASDRIQGHIEGSVSLPDEKTTCEELDTVLANLDAPALFYCNGPKCGRSAVAVNIAIGCGYKNVYWFRGGFEEWKKKKYPYIKE